MRVQIDQNTTQDFEKASHLEWLETNGLGGWASSSVCGAHTRRYHGILVASTQPPLGRTVLLSKLDETLEIGGQRYELGCNRFPGVVHPQGHRYLDCFEKTPFPTFHYSVGAVRLRKTIAAINGENTTVVLIELVYSADPILLRLRPFFAARDFHSMSHSNDSIERHGEFREGILKVRPYPDTPAVFVSVPRSTFRSEPLWYWNFEYSVEEFRGLDYREDLFSYGEFRVTLRPGQVLGVIVSTRDPSGRDAQSMLEQETQRRGSLLGLLPHRDDLSEALALASDQFLVRRGDAQSTIIAGYHWFGDWGRDTMVALPGVTLATGRCEIARNILRLFSRNASQGILPNRFPDSGGAPEYNTVDATLWFFVATLRYWQYTGDDAFVRDELLTVLADLIRWYEKGTLHAIHVDRDGLLYAGVPGVQLTWMDAKVGDWVVTPRQGKAVEVNALWYNALRIFAFFLARYGQKARAATVERKARTVKKRFGEFFWDPSLGYLYDYVDEEYRDAALRPNQIFALSLPFPLLEGEEAGSVLKAVEKKLYTPFGLRSLSPDHPSFRPYYGGDPYTRDSAYHQGTSWSWLLGPFVTALRRFGGAGGREKARDVICRLVDHLETAGLGTVSEIFDATPPHTPRGAIGQAWSVGEILRAYLEEVLGFTPKPVSQQPVGKGAERR